MSTLDRDGIIVPDGYPAHLIVDAREKADHVRPGAKGCPTEDAAHASVLKLLRDLARASVISPKDFWWTPNEGRNRNQKKGSKGKEQADRKAFAAGARDKRKGLISGVSDIIIARRVVHRGETFGAVAIEMKRARRSLSNITDHQREWLAARREQGWIAEICFGAREAIELLHACYGW